MRAAVADIIFQSIILLLTTSEIFCCYFATRDDSCDDLDQYLVSRKDWKAQPPSSPLECLWRPAQYVIIHHTVTDPCDDDDSCSTAVKNIQKEHLEENKWPDIGYHFVICGNGKAYVGRPQYKVGGHTKGHNRKSIGIAFLGEYSKTSPTAEMLDLVPKIAYCGVQNGYIDPNFLVIGHRDAYCTFCPGNALYAEIKKWPRFPDSVPIPSFTCDVISDTTVQPDTTTSAATTVKATTEMVITTTAAATTTPVPTTSPVPATTTAAVTTTEDSKLPPPQPVYYYILMSKKPIPADILNKIIS